MDAASTSCVCDTGYSADGTQQGGKQVTSSACLPIEYTISFDLNGADGQNPANVTVKYDNDMPKLESVPTWSGYKFNGWFDKNQVQYYSNTGVSMRKYAQTDNITLYAAWIAGNAQTITYDTKGGNIISADYVKSCNVITPTFMLPDVVKAGYEFKGWLNSAGGTVDKVEQGTCTTGLTFEAQWTPKIYSIKLDNGDGTLNEGALQIIYETEIQVSDASGNWHKLGGEYTKVDVPSRDGYQFDGYWTGVGGTLVEMINETGMILTDNLRTNLYLEDVTLYAKWVPNKYEITYSCGNTNDVTGTPPIVTTRISYNSTFELADTISTCQRQGYEADGWTDEIGNIFKSGESIEWDYLSDQTFTVNWKQKMIICPARQYLPKDSVTCTDCPMGYKCPAESIKYEYDGQEHGRTFCGGATYQDATKATDCKEVPTGYYTNSTHTKINECPYDAWCDAGVKYECPRSGKTKEKLSTSINQCYLSDILASIENGTATKSCNYTSGDGDSAVYDTDCVVTVKTCNAGYYRKTNTSECIPVDNGYFSADGALIQTNCSTLPGAHNLGSGNYRSELPRSANTDCWFDSTVFEKENCETAVPHALNFKGTYWPSLVYDVTAKLGYEAIYSGTENAACTPNVWTVSFNKNKPENATANVSGEQMNPNRYYYNQKSNLPKNAYSLVGYRFTGWNTSIDGQGETYANNANVKNLTSTDATVIDLYAQWTPNKYIVTYSCGTGATGTAPASDTATYDEEFTLANNQNCTKAGYVFDGWKGISQNFKAGQTIVWDQASKIEFEAVWVLEGNKPIDLIPNGGKIENYTPISCNVESAPIELPIPSKTGYTFNGWLWNGNVVEYTDSAMCENGATLSAKWDANTYNVTYSCGDDVDGNAPDADSVEYDSVLTLPENAGTCKLQGYEFTGWTDMTNNAEYQKGEEIDYVFDFNKTFVATYQIKSIECAVGEYLPASAELCQPCDAGFKCPDTVKIYTYSTTDSQGATACSKANEYQPQTGQTSCKVIEGGYIKVSDTTLENCGKNHYCIAGKKTQCPDGGLTESETASQSRDCYKTDTSILNGTGTKKCYLSVTQYDLNCVVTDVLSCNSGYYKNGNNCKFVEKGYYSAKDELDRHACSELSGANPDGGTYSSVSPYATNTDCRYTAPNKAINGCATVEVQQVAYNGTTYPETTYVVTANTGYEAKDSGTSNPTCELKTYNVGYKCDYGMELQNVSQHQFGSTFTIESGDICERKYYTFSGWVASDGRAYNGGARYTLSEDTDVTFTAQWVSNAIECTAGTYYSGTGDRCTECPPKSFCNGSQTIFEKNSGKSEGIESCPPEYPNSIKGTKTKDNCYAVVEKSGKQLDVIIPKNCSDVEKFMSCNPTTCTYNDYYGQEGETCDSATDCYPTATEVVADQGAYVDGNMCYTCPGKGDSVGGKNDKSDCFDSNIVCDVIEDGVKIGEGTQTCYYGTNAYTEKCSECTAFACGKGFILDGDKCVPCPAGYVCDPKYDGGKPYTCTERTGGAYPYSDEGASSITGCYAKCEIRNVENGIITPVDTKAPYLQQCKYKTMTDHECEVVGNTCYEFKCRDGWEKVNGICQECDRENALSYKPGGNCVIESCVSGYHPEGQQCAEDVRSCEASNAIVATQTWDHKKGAFGVCIIQECDGGYHVERNICKQDDTTCALPHGIGEREWDESLGKWGDCIATECFPGYTNDPNLTDSMNYEQCGECNNKYDASGEQLVSSYVRECEIGACMFHGEKYWLENNECISICEDLDDETGTRRWNPKTNKCDNICNPGYQSW